LGYASTPMLIKKRMNCIHGTTLSIRQSSGIPLYNIFVLVRKDLETHGTLFFTNSET